MDPTTLPIKQANTTKLISFSSIGDLLKVKLIDEDNKPTTATHMIPRGEKNDFGCNEPDIVREDTYGTSACSMYSKHLYGPHERFVCTHYCMCSKVFERCIVNNTVIYNDDGRVQSHTYKRMELAALIDSESAKKFPFLVIFYCSPSTFQIVKNLGGCPSNIVFTLVQFSSDVLDCWFEPELEILRNAWTSSVLSRRCNASLGPTSMFLCLFAAASLKFEHSFVFKHTEIPRRKINHKSPLKTIHEVNKINTNITEVDMRSCYCQTFVRKTDSDNNEFRVFHNIMSPTISQLLKLRFDSNPSSQVTRAMKALLNSWWGASTRFFSCAMLVIDYARDELMQLERDVTRRHEGCEIVCYNCDAIFFKGISCFDKSCTTLQVSTHSYKFFIRLLQFMIYIDTNDNIMFKGVTHSSHVISRVICKSLSNVTKCEECRVNKDQVPWSALCRRVKSLKEEDVQDWVHNLPNYVLFFGFNWKMSVVRNNVSDVNGLLFGVNPLCTITIKDNNYDLFYFFLRYSYHCNSLHKEGLTYEKYIRDVQNGYDYDKNHAKLKTMCYDLIPMEHHTQSLGLFLIINGEQYRCSIHCKHIIIRPYFLCTDISNLLLRSYKVLIR